MAVVVPYSYTDESGLILYMSTPGNKTSVKGKVISVVRLLIIILVLA